MSVEGGKNHPIRNRILNFTREAIFMADSLLLTQPRAILSGFDTEAGYEYGTVKTIGIKEALKNGTLEALPLVLFPPAIGALTHLVTQRTEFAIAAAGVAYVVEGAFLDFCEAMAYFEGSYQRDDRFTYPLQRKLAELADYPKMTPPFWFS